MSGRPPAVVSPAVASPVIERPHVLGGDRSTNGHHGHTSAAALLRRRGAGETAPDQVGDDVAQRAAGIVGELTRQLVEIVREVDRRPHHQHLSIGTSRCVPRQHPTVRRGVDAARPRERPPGETPLSCRSRVRPSGPTSVTDRQTLPLRCGRLIQKARENRLDDGLATPERDGAPAGFDEEEPCHVQRSPRPLCCTTSR